MCYMLHCVYIHIRSIELLCVILHCVYIHCTLYTVRTFGSLTTKSGMTVLLTSSHAGTFDGS